MPREVRGPERLVHAVRVQEQEEREVSARVWVFNPTDVSDDEQGDRIREGLADWMANPDDYSFEDLEDLFEDRDPCEFL